MDCCSLVSDAIFFHPDDSGRIFHVGPATIKWVLESAFTVHETMNETCKEKLVKCLWFGGKCIQTNISWDVRLLWSGPLLHKQIVWYFLYFYYVIILDLLYNMFFFFSSVLKIKGELNSGLPSKVVKDFSMATLRNNNVSVIIYLLSLICCVFIQT